MNAQRNAHDDSGFTLVELLVAMVITGMVLAMSGSFFVNISRAAAAARSDRQAMAQVALAVDAVRNTVSAATDNPTSATVTTPAVVFGTTTALTVISYANTSAASATPSQYAYALDAAGYLTETRQTGVLSSTNYWGFSSGVTTTRRIAGPFLTTGAPFFSFIDRTGAQIALGGSGLAAADRSSVAFVRVTARAARTTHGGSTTPVTAMTTVGLTNVYRDIAATVTLPAPS